jgi:hypothetical protein
VGVDVDLGFVELRPAGDVVPDHHAIGPLRAGAFQHDLERRGVEQLGLVVGDELLVPHVDQGVDRLALRDAPGFGHVGVDPIAGLMDGHLALVPRTDARGNGVLVLIEHDEHDVLQGRQPCRLVVEGLPGVGIRKVVVIVPRSGREAVATELGVGTKSPHGGVLAFGPLASRRLVGGSEHLLGLGAGETADQLGTVVADERIPLVVGTPPVVEDGIDARAPGSIAPEETEELGVDEQQAVEGRVGNVAIEDLRHHLLEPLPVLRVSLGERKALFADVGRVELFVEHGGVSTDLQIGELDAIGPFEPVDAGVGLAARGHPPHGKGLLSRRDAGGPCDHGGHDATQGAKGAAQAFGKTARRGM